MKYDPKKMVAVSRYQELSRILSRWQNDKLSATAI